MTLSFEGFIISVRLNTAYFAENTVAKYFLLLKFTVHPQFALGWSMNIAMDQPKNITQENANTISLTQTGPKSMLDFSNKIFRFKKNYHTMDEMTFFH